MITFDTEDDGHGNFFLCNFYDGKNHKPFELKNFKNEYQFRECIINYIFSQRENEFFAHNLEYDLSHIFQGVFLTAIDWYFSDRLLYATIPNTRKKFIDSFNFSFSSLAVVGEQIGLEKMEIDVENLKSVYAENPSMVVDYCKIDCEIVYKYMDSVNLFLKDNFQFKRKVTIAGTSQNLFLKNFCNYKIGGLNVDDDLLKAYYGGRTEVFKLGKIERPVFGLDVNSMYPYVMAKNKFPTGEFYKTETPQTELYVAKIKIKIKPGTDIPIIPCRKEKLMFPAGEFETWAASPEIEAAQAAGQIESIEYLETFNFAETDFLFSEFINYFYDLRKIAKDNGDKFQSNFLKRVMNSVYGRFALHNGLKVLTAITEENENEIDPINEIAGYMDLNIDSNKNKNYAIALFITSYARIELWNLLKSVQEHGYNILYCDTDSCFFYSADSLYDVCKKLYSEFEIDNEIGNYSLSCYAGAEFKNLKEYMLISFLDKESYTLKGIKTAYRKEFFTTGKTEYKKPVRLRTSLRSDLKVNSWLNMKYQKQSVYDKRTVQADGRTAAVNLTAQDILLSLPFKEKIKRSPSQIAAAQNHKDKINTCKIDMINHIQNLIDDREITIFEFINDPAAHYDKQILGAYINNPILLKSIEKYFKEKYYL